VFVCESRCDPSLRSPVAKLARGRSTPTPLECEDARGSSSTDDPFATPPLMRMGGDSLQERARCLAPQRQHDLACLRDRVRESRESSRLASMSLATALEGATGSTQVSSRMMSAFLAVQPPSQHSPQQALGAGEPLFVSMMH